MTAHYDELLKMCGFDNEEIDRERPRMEEAFRRLELQPDDFKAAESFVRQNHEVELLGVRKIMRLWILELLDLVLARDEGRRLVYYGFPTIAGPSAVIASASDDILCTCPDVVLCSTMGQIFNKINPILEAGEQNGLPPGHSLCSLQQVRVGGMAKGIVPVADLVLTSSYYCDMGSKTDELLHERYGHPAIYVDGSMDSRWEEFPDYRPERLDFLGGEIDKALSKVEEILGVQVTEEARQEGAIRSKNLLGVLNEMGAIMRDAVPQPISIVTVEMARRLISGSSSKRLMVEGPKAIALLNQEIRDRVEKGIGGVDRDAPRVMILLSHFSDPTTMRMMEDCGLSVPITVYAALAAKFWTSIPSITGKVLAAEEMKRGTFHSSTGILKRVAEVVTEFNMDGLIWNYIYNCRPVAITSHMLKEFVEKETGIPVLSLEMDPYDSRAYTAGALKSRVETFAEILRARKPAAMA